MLFDWTQKKRTLSHH
uniref:Uncharacterized protein n=1 Tax=Rhizophora mucronata TaxID=61149 RepID=A0A2P2J1H4_RHIMU